MSKLTNNLRGVVSKIGNFVSNFSLSRKYIVKQKIYSHIQLQTLLKLELESILIIYT